MDVSYTSVREEVIERLKQRDFVISLYAGFLTLVVGFVSSSLLDLRFLLVIPFLAITFALLSLYHDVLIEYLHRYCQRLGSGWDISREHREYARRWRWLYLCVQISVFCGTSFLSLFLTIPVVVTSSYLLFVWFFSLLGTFIVFFLFLYVRLFRHVHHLR